MVTAHFRGMARYNRWANLRLYDAAAHLSEPDYKRPRGAFFSSLHGTLNHILAADLIWLRRLTETGEAPDRLDAELGETLPALRAAREEADARFIALTDSYYQEDFDHSLRYTDMAGQRHSVPLAQVLAHVFNHQTHHRGQAHCLLSQAGQKPPPLDLIYFVYETQDIDTRAAARTGPRDV